jgi:hypothetical protein
MQNARRASGPLFQMIRNHEEHEEHERYDTVVLFFAMEAGLEDGESGIHRAIKKEGILA